MPQSHLPGTQSPSASVGAAAKIVHDEPVSRIVLVGCGSTKKDQPTRASHLYTSSYFEMKRKYARNVGDVWRILSAEHGLVHPQETLEPYNTRLTGAKNEAREWGQKVSPDLSALVESPQVADDAKVVVLAGKNYSNPIRGALSHLPVRPIYPFEPTQGIGDQMGLLSVAIERWRMERDSDCLENAVESLYGDRS